MNKQSVAIVGGGLAGMTLALALHRNNISVTLYDARAEGAAHRDERVLALAEGSRLFYEELGVWQSLQSQFATYPIQTIHVSQPHCFGRVLMEASDEQLPAFGYVLRAGDLAQVLTQKIAAKNISFQHLHPIDAVKLPEADLLVWAEGSVTAQDAIVHEYGQSALVFRAQMAVQQQQGRAWELFTREGPVAALPLGNELAIIMSGANKDSEVLRHAPESQVLDVLQKHFGDILRFRSIGIRQIFPLRLSYRRNIVAKQMVWIGNAAQTLHPVAGQGFNLALRDIATLSRILSYAADFRDFATVERYARARRVDRQLAIWGTDALVRFFGREMRYLPFVQTLRGLGLCLVDSAPSLRSFVAQRMMFGLRSFG